MKGPLNTSVIYHGDNAFLFWLCKNTLLLMTDTNVVFEMNTSISDVRLTRAAVTNRAHTLQSSGLISLSSNFTEDTSVSSSPHTPLGFVFGHACIFLDIQNYTHMVTTAKIIAREKQ